MFSMFLFVIIDQSKLMFSIGLSGDSLDSSSEDDVIPMQSRKKKRSFTRKKYAIKLTYMSTIY